MFEIMKDSIDRIGGLSFVTGMILSVNRWLSNIDYSLTINILTVVSLGFGIIYVAMRSYHQFLETRNFKKKNRDGRT